MFKKIVSNLPFNPSLIENFPAFSSQLRRERKLRIIGLVILLLALIGQILITIFPATPTIASSPNDLIYGGTQTQSELVQDCNSNLSDYKTILAYFSISCTDLNQANQTTLQTNSLNTQLVSLNRVGYGVPEEKQVYIGNTTLWLRYLGSGSSLRSANLKALVGTSSTGTKFYDLFDSGNIVFIGMPPISSSCSSNINVCPSLYLSARDQTGQISNANGALVHPNDVLIYTLAATNNSNQTIKNYLLGTNFSSTLAYSRILNTYGGSINNSVISWPIIVIKPGQTMTRTVSFIVNNPVVKTPVSATDPNYYNLKMTTIYGNVISIKLPTSFSKYYEISINNRLPSAGKFSSLLLSILLVIYVSYFLARNILMLRELDHLKDDYISGGTD